MKTIKFALAILIVSLVFSGCNVSVNRTIRIADGETVEHGPKTVNGSIFIGNHCKILGASSTVNGKISVGDNCRVEDLETVNSGISIGKGTVVEGNVSTVNGSITCSGEVSIDGKISTINGSITCGPKVTISREISNINGRIQLTSTIVKNDITTHNGGITLLENSEVGGDIIIRESHGSHRKRNLIVRISGGSVVKGDIINNDDDMKVDIILEGGGKVEGKIKNAQLKSE